MNESKNVIRNNMLWNVIGSTFFCGCQWIMSVLIVHIAGYTEAGVLALGFSITNTFLNIGYYSVRSFQVSDITNQYSPSDYVTHRIFTCTFSYIIYGIFILISGYSRYMLWFLLMFMLYRLLEAYVDVFHGIAQKGWRLDIAGKSYIFRGIIMLVCFVVVESLTKNLIITSIAMFLLSGIVVLGYDMVAVRKMEPYHFEWDMKKVWQLMIQCFPILMYSLFINGIITVPRYLLEMKEGSSVLGYYASVAIPASIVQMLCMFVLNPFIQLFAEYKNGERKKDFRNLIIKMTVLITVLTLVSILAALLLGEWVLVLLFDETIREYVYLLFSTIICSGLMALVWFFGSIIVVIRKINYLAIGALAGFVLCVCSSIPLITRIGVDGVNSSIIVSFFAVACIYIVRIIIYLKGWGKSVE